MDLIHKILRHDLMDLIHKISRHLLVLLFCFRGIAVSEHLTVQRLPAPSLKILTRMRTQVVTLQLTTSHCNTLQHRWSHCNSLQLTATHCNTGGRTAHLFPTGLLKWQVSQTALRVGECCSALQCMSHCVLERVLQGAFQRVCMYIISVREYLSRNFPPSIRLNSCNFIVCMFSINQIIIKFPLRHLQGT